MLVSSIQFLTIGILLSVVHCQTPDYFLYEQFPTGFKWGYATAAYQIEGGWNASGKGVNIWDTWTHLEESPIDDKNTGDVACDSYHKWREDVRILKEAKAKLYRFSLSWSRILPSGKYAGPESINPDGIRYYNQLIDALISEEIEPMVTLFHWDTPQPLEDEGGWPSESIIPHYVNFSRVAFVHFGDRVKNWITFNEPWVVCWQGYGVGSKAPGIVDPDTRPYNCAHTIIKTHAETYRMYEAEFKPSHGGRVGITLDTYWYESATEKVEDVAAAGRTLQFHHGWFAAPLYFGDYPTTMKETIGRRSAEEGLPSSRLPSFTQQESERIKGTVDFLGLNHYTSAMVTHNPNSSDKGWAGDQESATFQSPTWPCSASSWLKVNPTGFRKLLKWLKDTYGNPEIFVTENGTSEDDVSAGAFGPTGLNDVARSYYYTTYINNMLKAIRIDGVNVSSYTAWSLMDNFEWRRGYTQRFGAHRVEFDDPERIRRPKESVSLLKEVFDDNGFLRPDSGVERKYHDIIQSYTPGEEKNGSRRAGSAATFIIICSILRNI